MKPQGWDNFLQQVADRYQLKGKLRELFLVRFAYKNWRTPDKQVWELAASASLETYKKQMTAIYGYFGPNNPEGCPELELHGKGPGKFAILRDWLQQIKYPEWQQSVTTPAPEAKTPFSCRLPVPWGSPFYIPRPPIETDCCREILQPGALIRIKAPEKTGKTSLLRRILAHADYHGYRTVYLNLQEAERPILSDLSKLLRWFCANISRELGVVPQLDDYWDEELFGSLISCKTYVQAHLLQSLDAPLALGLDNVDRVFEYTEVAQDFLPMLRSWNEEANNQEIWLQLRLVLAHSTDIYIDLDVNQSPFNVGWPVKLPGFILEQVLHLAKAYNLDWVTDAQARQSAIALVEMVGGHPYLVQLALEAITHQQTGLEQLLDQAPTQAGIYGGHLRNQWETLQQQPELVAAMRQVVSEKMVQLQPIYAYKLESMGLVTLVGDAVQPSCELYRQYFGARL